MERFKISSLSNPCGLLASERNSGKYPIDPPPLPENFKLGDRKLPKDDTIRTISYGLGKNTVELAGIVPYGLTVTGREPGGRSVQSFGFYVKFGKPKARDKRRAAYMRLFQMHQVEVHYIDSGDVTPNDEIPAITDKEIEEDIARVKAATPVKNDQCKSCEVRKAKACPLFHAPSNELTDSLIIEILNLEDLRFSITPQITEIQAQESVIKKLRTKVETMEPLTYFRPDGREVAVMREAKWQLKKGADKVFNPFNKKTEHLFSVVNKFKAELDEVKKKYPPKDHPDLYIWGFRAGDSLKQFPEHFERIETGEIKVAVKTKIKPKNGKVN